MRGKKLVISLLILILGVVALVTGYLFYKPHRSIDQASLVRVSADSLFLAYQQDEATANARYLDKALEITGTIAALQNNQQGQKVVIVETGDPMGGIACTLKNPNEKLKQRQRIVIRGFCSGYLSDVIIRDAEIVP